MPDPTREAETPGGLTPWPTAPLCLAPGAPAPLPSPRHAWGSPSARRGCSRGCSWHRPGTPRWPRSPTGVGGLCGCLRVPPCQGSERDAGWRQAGSGGDEHPRSMSTRVTLSACVALAQLPGTTVGQGGGGPGGHHRLPSTRLGRGRGGQGVCEPHPRAPGTWHAGPHRHMASHVPATGQHHCRSCSGGPSPVCAPLHCQSWGRG